MLSIWENFSHSFSSQKGNNTEILKIYKGENSYHMLTLLNIRQYRWQKHYKLQNKRKPFKSHTLLYNIEITQVGNPLSKMNVRKFSVRGAITRHPKAHMNEKLLSVSWALRNLFTPVGLILEHSEGITAKIALDTEAFIRSDVSVNVKSFTGVEPL